MRRRCSSRPRETQASPTLCMALPPKFTTSHCEGEEEDEGKQGREGGREGEMGGGKEGRNV